MTAAARTPLLVGVGAASAFGGVLAVLAVAVWRDITRPGVVGAAVLVVTALCLLAAVTTTATSEPQPVPDRRVGPPVPAAQVAPPPPPPPPPPPGRRSRTVEIPLHEPAPGRPVVRQRAQCPRCGDFDLAVQQLRHQLGLSCLACGHAWYWAPGQAWPVTVVRPGLAAARPPAQAGPPSFRLKA